MMENPTHSQAADGLFILDEEDDDNLNNRYLTFGIGNEDFGISISNVIEINEMQKIIKLPNMPDYIKGVINRRGRVIPVMDLRLRFKSNAKEYDDRTCIIITIVKDLEVGLIVDNVQEALMIPSEQIELPPRFKGAFG